MKLLSFLDKSFCYMQRFSTPFFFDLLQLFFDNIFNEHICTSQLIYFHSCLHRFGSPAHVVHFTWPVQGTNAASHINCHMKKRNVDITSSEQCLCVREELLYMWRIIVERKGMSFIGREAWAGSCSMSGSIWTMCTVTVTIIDTHTLG